MPGTQESKAPTPLLRQSGIRRLKKPKDNKRSNLRFVFGAKNCLCRDLSRAAGGLVSQRFDERFPAFRGLSRPLKALFSRFRGLPGLSRPVRGHGFCATQHIRGLRGLESLFFSNFGVPPTPDAPLTQQGCRQTEF